MPRFPKPPVSRDDKGASFVEYSIILGLVSVVGISAVFQLGKDNARTFAGVSSTLETARVNPDSLASSTANTQPPPSPEEPTESCYDPALIGSIGGTNWEGGCEGQLIVSREQLYAAVSNRSFSIPGPERSHPIGGGERAIFTGQISDFTGLFSGVDFNQDINWWNMSRARTLYTMFYTSTFNQPLGDWDVGQVRDFTLAFASSPFNQNINGWNVSNSNTFYSMFYDSDFNQPLNGWDVSNAHTFYAMFYQSPFNQNIGDWQMDRAQDLRGMFHQTPFNQNINSWDVSNVSDFYGMFSNTPFNQNLNDWDVSSASNMEQMFLNAPAMSQDLSGWCVPQFATEPSFFAQGSALRPEQMPIWGTCPTP